MAGSKSDYLEKAILDYLLGGVTITLPASVYIALSTAAYSDAATGAAMSEVSASGTAYARVAVARSQTTGFAASTGTNPALTSNINPVSWPTATGAGFGGGTTGVQSFYIVDSPTVGAGNILYGGDLQPPKVVNAGDTPTFAAGQLQVTED